MSEKDTRTDREWKLLVRNWAVLLEVRVGERFTSWSERIAKVRSEMEKESK